MKKIKETDLYKPIYDYMAKNGYNVKSEVKDCDVVAIKDDNLIIIELKKSINLTLLVQAVERQRRADSVYIAVPRPENLPKNWKDIVRLLKKLELGLIFVVFLKKDTRVDIIFHPNEYVERKSKKQRFAIIEEIKGRTGNRNIGGSRRTAIMTAYKEQNIFIACCLEKNGPLSAKELKKIGTGEKTSSILIKNFYGWFDRVERGVYKLNDKGKEEMGKYPDIVEYYKNN
ncbi:DUF2161 domain-containing phosphodiesterase [Haliovirga abyssi]|uniref:ERCC4 domain-containing protein n=1 Tax=Haliovirga abyssi TaxID=2996794 RepID=A0AAU9DCV1_9FUSO|nr:DUF2161 family putative PD-(D/E)XK-type phosphodiesterase [Haliovirga abyssi]BDU51336.1 hypothetical protein HLVA_19050 [Haliovirga abyssi]